jgi:DNA polymerase delta subunit 1
LKCEGEFAKVAPLRIMSFDIECMSERGKFPTPDADSIIQIANVCQISGQEEPFARNIFTRNTCASIVGTQVFSFKKEADLLFAWREFLRLVDPDIVTGYNIITFDLPFICGRAIALDLK